MRFRAALRRPLATVAGLLFGGGLLASWGGCATPAETFDRDAQQRGFLAKVVEGSEFSHVIYYGPNLPKNPRLVHVYLQGDASPRSAMRYRPPDPTPKNDLVLRLMDLDPTPSLLLGRPCQHGRAPCDAFYWTVGRYNEAVVQSLVETLKTEQTALGSPEVVLVGFSGGGALAMLIAERIANARAVITIAGNLDPERWALHHGYTPLSGSLDPAKRPPLDPRIFQFHLVGEDDERIPLELTRDAIARQPNAQTRRYEDFDHTCCWDQVWPDVLAEMGLELKR